MTPAPVTPASPGHTPHNQAEDHTSPPAENAARTRCSLSPGISATPSPAEARPTAHNPVTTVHLLPPSPQESASRDWTQRPSGPRPLSLSHRRYSSSSPLRTGNVSRNILLVSGYVDRLGRRHRGPAAEGG